MTIKEIIQRLRNEGHSIEAYKRPDGGYLIQSIDGIKYSGATGNTIARSMVGSEGAISSRRESQLRSITPKVGSQRAKQRKKGYPKKAPLPEDVKRQLRKTQTQWRKTKKTGRITTSQVRYQIEQYGLDEAMAKLKKLEQYARGIAYDENVSALADRIQSLTKYCETMANSLPSNQEELKQSYLALKQDIQALADRIRGYVGQNKFKEDWIPTINGYFYDFTDNPSTEPSIRLELLKDAVRKSEALLR